MSFYIENKLIKTDKSGYLLEQADWNDAVCLRIAQSESIYLTQAHWNVILLDRTFYAEYLENKSVKLPVYQNR